MKRVIEVLDLYSKRAYTIQPTKTTKKTSYSHERVSIVDKVTIRLCLAMIEGIAMVSAAPYIYV